MKHLKGFEIFESKSLKGKLGFLVGSPISLVKTLHTIGKWNEKENRMDEKTIDEDINGFIGEIGDYEGYDTPGFWLIDEHGKKKGFVMWDEKKREFIEGVSSYHYTYKGKTEKDVRTLQLVVDNLV